MSQPQREQIFIIGVCHESWYYTVTMAWHALKAIECRNEAYRCWFRGKGALERAKKEARLIAEDCFANFGWLPSVRFIEASKDNKRISLLSSEGQRI